MLPDVNRQYWFLSACYRRLCVAGIGAMTYRKYITYCIAGAILWVSLLTFTGFAFGNIPWIKKNFELVVIGIILISLLPIVFEYIKHKMTKTDAQ